METKKIQCPHCGAELEPKDGIDSFYCSYCGGEVILEGLSDAAYRAKVQIKEMEHRETLKDKEFEQEKYRTEVEKEKKKRSLKTSMGAIALYLLLMAMLAIFSLYRNSVEKKEHDQTIASLQQTEVEIEAAMSEENYDLALIKANQLYGDDGLTASEKRTWNEKRENYIKLIKARTQEDAPAPAPTEGETGTEDVAADAIVPMSAAECYLKQNYKDVMLRFENAGFTNIETEEVADIKNGLIVKEGEVSKVTINGEVIFNEGDVYPSDAVIRIYYHVKKEE